MIIKNILNDSIQKNLKYTVCTCHVTTYPCLSDGRWQKAHFFPREKKDVTEIILDSIGDITIARLQSIECQFTC